MRDFENRDVVRILGVHPRTLMDWSEIGLVVPEVDADGTGTRRRYSERNLVTLAIINALLKDGLRRDLVKAITSGFADASADGPLSLHAPQVSPGTLCLLIDLETCHARWVTMPSTAEMWSSIIEPRRSYIVNVSRLKDEIRGQQETKARKDSAGHC